MGALIHFIITVLILGLLIELIKIAIPFAFLIIGLSFNMPVLGIVGMLISGYIIYFTTDSKKDEE